MKKITALIFTVLIAINMENCRAKFLLVKVDDDVRNTFDDNSITPNGRLYLLYSENKQN